MTENIWNEIINDIKEELKKDNLDIWFSSIKKAELKDDVLEIEVPNSFYIDQISKKEDLIKNRLKILNGKDIKIRYAVKQEETKDDILKENEAKIDNEVVVGGNIFKSNINPDYTFDNMIISEFNKFAASHSKQIANENSKDKILFIYSNPGLGKTHMLHAIGNEILKSKPQAKVLYTTAEVFVNEYIDSIKQNRVDNFRTKYRNLDCLLIDDVQFIVAKEKSEEEFFFTFNALSDYGKKIIISSDRPPNDIAVNERLISRFKIGAVADIKSPEYEARMAILKKENETHKYNIPDDVINFIAENVKDSIRSLKGCISTVYHYSYYSNEYPTIDKTKEWIKDFLTINTNAQPTKITIEDIQRIISEEYGITVEELKSKQRSERFAFPRQIAIYISCEISGLSLPEIGKQFNKDHSTVIHARDKIRQILNSDPFFSEKINNLINRIKNKNVN